MTIHYSFASETVTRTDEDGNEYESERRGELQVWFHDAEPKTDSPHQTYDWRGAGDNLTWSNDLFPIEVKQVCAKREIDSELEGEQPFNKRAFKIYRDLMTESIQRVE